MPRVKPKHAARCAVHRDRRDGWLLSNFDEWARTQGIDAEVDAREVVDHLTGHLGQR